MRVRWRPRSPVQPLPATGQPRVDDIVLANLDSAYNLARWLVRDPSLADDVVQDAVVKAISYFASFKGGDGRAWLMKIVRNTALTALASQRSSGARQLGDDAGNAAFHVPDGSEDPEAALARKQDAARLGHALAALPIEIRECLVLKELEELSYKEIAEIVGVPIGTVMSRLWRARRALVQGPCGAAVDE